MIWHHGIAHFFILHFFEIWEDIWVLFMFRLIFFKILEIDILILNNKYFLFILDLCFFGRLLKNLKWKWGFSNLCLFLLIWHHWSTHILGGHFTESTEVILVILFNLFISLDLVVLDSVLLNSLWVMSLFLLICSFSNNNLLI